jgi:hypothetical protein
MFGRVKMLGGVLVLRRIAASDVATNHAQSKVHPLVAQLQALLAAFGMRLHVLNLIQVLTFTHIF